MARNQQFSVTDLNDALHKYVADVITAGTLEAVAHGGASAQEIGWEIVENFENTRAPVAQLVESSDPDLLSACIRQLVGLGGAAIQLIAKLLELTA